jgi:hypothetical protein
MAEFRTDPGDRNISALEREVDHERERVSSTIDELQSRASMGNIVDQLVKAVGENGGEVSHNLGRSLRDNPLAALMTGVGLAWLMAGSGGASGKAAADWNPEDPQYRAGRDPDWRTFGVSGSATDGGSMAGPGRPHEGAASSEGLGQRAASFASKIGEGATETVGDLKGRAGNFVHSVGTGLGKAGDAVRDTGAAAHQHAAAVRRGAAGTGRDLRHGLDTFIEEQPLVLGAIAMAIGAAVGGALPRSRVEDKMFGEQSDEAMERVRTLAEEQGAKLQATASSLVDEALSIADEASAELGSKLPSGEEIVDAAKTKVREAGERLQEAAKSELASDSDQIQQRD